MDKQTLRKEYKEKRKSLTHKQLTQMDDLLLLQLQRFSFEDVRYVLSYMPISRWNEPGTKLLTRYMQFIMPDIQICYPKTNMETGTMEAIAIDDTTELETNIWGITEPMTGLVVDPIAIDVILLPLLICDKKGNRVGYGKGFYDKYILQCDPSTIKIGISFFQPIEEISDVLETDQKLDYCITPMDIYAF